MKPNPDPNYPIKEIHKVLIEGVKEIIGPEDARSVLSQAGRNEPALPFLREVQRALAVRYGPLSGQGVALRTGRAVFKYGLRVWGEESGVTSSSYRLMPFSRRVRTGLEKMAVLFSRHCQAQVSVSEDEAAWYWQVESCPACVGGAEGEAACYLLTGLLQEYMAWAAGGKFFPVQEMSCAEAGSQACLFRIDKKALE